MNYFNYFSEIEELFVRKRGKNLLLSPLDWALIESWKERGVPLAIVLRAIEAVFEKAEAEPARKRAIKSLLYCRDAVEQEYENWLAGQIGAENEKEKTQNEEAEAAGKFENVPAGQGEIFAHLQLAAKQLRQPALNLNHNWQKISTEVLALLERARKEFHQNADLEKLETLLSELDRRIDNALLESFPAEKKSELEKENDAQLRPYKNRMTEAVYRQTLRTLLLKSLREKAEIPRLSLFYL
ncbi:MAG: hypothetical protein M3209_06515 [Acidobacteriota bacterium]|nr:hypothetical protein [Acidobacteriota bacterium]